MAKEYLCIPTPSTPSERAFGTGGNIVPCRRASLKPETTYRLVFLTQDRSFDNEHNKLQPGEEALF